jgi:hypothetical protein
MPVTAYTAEQFDRVRPMVVNDTTESVASAGDVAGETVTSEGRCPW